jgi:DNA-binding transcriptional MerR regulator
MTKTGKRFTIGEAARMLSVSVGTLRRWERERAIPQVPRHRRTGERQYDDALLERIQRYRDGEDVPRKRSA